MRPRAKWVCLIAVISFSGAASATRMRLIQLKADDQIQAPRWMYEKSAKVKGPEIITQLVDIREAQNAKKYSVCDALVRKATAKAQGLLPWLHLTQLQCATEGVRRKEMKLATLQAAIKTVGDKPEWLMWGASSLGMREAYAEAILTALELQHKSDRKAGWKNYDRLIQMWPQLDAQQRARAYKAAGEIAFIEQNIALAADLFSRSLDERDAPEVRKRMEALKIVSPKPQPPKPDPHLEMTPEEKSLFDRAHQAYQSGDLLSVVDDGIKIIQKFSGGLGAQWANDKILEIYLNLAPKNGDFKNLKKRAVSLMLKADADRLYRWALNAHVRGHYQDALEMAETCVEAYGGQSEALKALTLSANSALHSGDNSKAEEYYQRIANEFSGTDEAKQALIRLGLVKFRAKKYSDSSAFFERVLASPTAGDWEYTALYWHWRSQQQLKAPTAVLLAERLVQRYPLTYYGLRARAELNGGVLSFNKSPGGSVKSEMWLSESQSQAWERFLLLLKAGWFDEAQLEIQQLPEPKSPEEKVVRARLMAAAFDHFNAIRTFNDVWTVRPELLHIDLIRSAFPVEFKSYIERFGNSVGLDAALISGLIRQESSFQTKVISPSNAYGLMQILPSTGKEVSARWRPQPKFPDDLSDPEVNIRIGSVYLSRLIRAFKGHVPLALASYNAGIGRIRRWQAARKDASELEQRLTSDPLSEIWIDELPWDETSLYVKAVLRNVLIYRVLDKGSVTLEDPVWKMLKL